MAGNSFTAEATATYDTTAPKFGSAALTGPYTDTNTASGTGGISGPTGLTTVGWSMEFWYKRAAAPSATSTPIGRFVNPGTIPDANSFFPAVATAGTLALNVFDTSATAVTTPSSANICDGTWRHIAITVTSSLIYLFVNGALVGTQAPASGHSITCAPANIAIGNAYGYPDFPDTGAEFNELAVWPTARYTAAFTPPTAQYAGTEGMVLLLHLAGNLTDSSAAATVTFLPNNAAIIYNPAASPGATWSITSALARAVNPGYIRTSFVGSAVKLTFDVSTLAGYFPQFYAVIDGVKTLYTVASSVTLTMPTNNSWGVHTLEIRTKSLTENEQRWSTLQSYLGLTGIVVTSPSGGTAALQAPNGNLAAAPWIAGYGDSITEAVRALGSTTIGAGADDTDGTDSTLGWLYLQRELLGVDVCNIGFGGSDVNLTDTYGNVPPTTQTYNQLWAGQPRVIGTMPAAVIVNLGTNGSQQSGFTQASYQAPFLTLLQGLLAFYPNVPIVVFQPFEGSGANMSPAARAAVTAAQQAAIAQAGSSLISFVSTTGWFNGNSAISFEGTHPYGCANIETIGPLVAAALRPIIFPAARSYSFR